MDETTAVIEYVVYFYLPINGTTKVVVRGGNGRQWTYVLISLTVTYFSAIHAILDYN